MKLIHVYHPSDDPPKDILSPWFTYANYVYFRSIFLLKSMSSKSVLDDWIRKGELVLARKPYEDISNQ